MPKLVLQFEDRVLKECAVATAMTIGRLPDNTVIVDNPAVSGRHARILREGTDFIVEDLESRNGTFVNGARVTRQALRHGDVVLIGKHKLVFDDASGDAPVEADAVVPTMPDFGGTVLLDTEQQRTLLAAAEARLQANAPPGGATPGSVGVLRVMGGYGIGPEYSLEAHTSIIGKSEAALVRLHGWFKPKVAVAIARMGDGYVATLLGGTTLINGQRLNGRRGLEDGDLLQVSGLTLEFRVKGSPAEYAPTSER